MAGNVNWNDAKLMAGLQKVERQCVSQMAEHWVGAAKDKVNVSAGGNNKKARAVRRTRGKITGILAQEYAKLKRQGYTPQAARQKVAETYETYRHSKPGEPPRSITGFGQKSIVWKMADTARPIARAGLFVNAMYMFFLEMGFTRRRRGAKSKRGGVHVAARPWMVKTFNEQMPAFRKIAGYFKASIN